MSTILADPPVEPTPETTALNAAEAAAAAPTPVNDWRANLPEEFRADPSLASFKDVPSLAKSYIETKKMVGAKTLKVPDDKSTPEERAAFNKALGVPDTPAGYEIKKPEIALTVGWNEEYETEFRALMYKHGATPGLVQALVDMHGQRIAAEHTNVVRTRQAAVSELKQEWGSEYAAKLGRANRALTQYGGDELVDLLSKPSMTPLGDHPILARAFAKIADDLIEHGVVSATGHEGTTPGEAEARIAELRQELLKHPVGSPRAVEIQNEMIALTKRLPPRA